MLINFWSGSRNLSLRLRLGQEHWACDTLAESRACLAGRRSQTKVGSGDRSGDFAFNLTRLVAALADGLRHRKFGKWASQNRCSIGQRVARLTDRLESKIEVPSAVEGTLDMKSSPRWLGSLRG